MGSGVPCRWGLPGKVAAGNIRRNLGRTAVAVAAFMVALSMSVGLGLMIGSFRTSLIEWIDTTVTADLYIDVAAADRTGLAHLEETVAAEHHAPDAIQADDIDRLFQGIDPGLL